MCINSLLSKVIIHGVVMTLMGLCVIGVGQRHFRSGFGLTPGTFAGWIAYWFHILEFLMVSCFYSLFVYGWRIDRYLGFTLLPWVALSSSLLLMTSSIAFWNIERASAKGGLWWVCLTLLIFLVIAACGGGIY